MKAVFQDLDNPIWRALCGPQRALGAAGTLAGIYDPDVAPFAGLREKSQAAFDELASLAGPGRAVAFTTPDKMTLPPGWRTPQIEPLEQFVCLDATKLVTGDDTVVTLGPADVPAMLALAEETKPGPFSSGTLRLGRYIGIRGVDGDGLAAMAGERLRLETAVEISAVCTASNHRGKGLAGRLVQILTADALGRAMTPFLHVRPGNTSAISLYETLGFQHRRTMNLTISQAPGG
jgi:ribosomal protein S18 acetylase RimI-like enzyme